MDGVREDADGRAELMFALLADARLPTGGHTQSAGLEPALRAGTAAADVPRYIDARLRTVVRVEAATAVVARLAALSALTAHGAHGAHGGPVSAEKSNSAPGSCGSGAEFDFSADGSADGVADGPAGRTAEGLLVEVWAAWAARTPSAALRETAQRLGRGYLRLLRRLWADSPAVTALDAATAVVGGHPPRPVVLGATAACAGLSALQTARLVAYEDVQTVASATLKLEPLDPAVATGWVVDAQPAIDALARDVAGIRVARDLPACGAPLVEAWAQAHATRTERLFSA